MNPYQSPQVAVSGVLDATSIKPRRQFSRIVRLVVGVPSLAAHLYFLAMFIAWSRSWYSGRIVPMTVREQMMYCGAVVCVVASAVLLYSLARNRWTATFAAASTTAISFALIVVLMMA